MQDTVFAAEVAAPAVASDVDSDVWHMNRIHTCSEIQSLKLHRLPFMR